MIEQAIEQARSGIDLPSDVMQSIIDGMLNSRYNDERIAQLLLALAKKGESVEELVGAARALRSHMIPVRTQHADLLDTCGTGGDGAKTFNISTAAALVAAAAGVPIAKHGNRKVTSLTGSADVLEQLGIRMDAPREVVERCIDEIGIGFCFAPNLHPAMRHVGQVRRSLGVPTLFNYLGPLCNPASASFQLLGVGRSDLQGKIAEALVHLPVRRALVVRGHDGMDEISLSASTRVLDVENGQVIERTWNPETFGLQAIDSKDLFADGPAQSAAIIRDLLNGRKGPPRDIVLANAAAGVWLCGREKDLITAVQRCAHAIDSGASLSLLNRLSAATQA